MLGPQASSPADYLSLNYKSQNEVSHGDN